MANCQYSSTAPAIPLLIPHPANQHYQNAEQHQQFHFQLDNLTVTSSKTTSPSPTVQFHAIFVIHNKLLAYIVDGNTFINYLKVIIDLLVLVVSSFL